MGTWGLAISSNDAYADVYSAFFDHYNSGKSVTEATQIVIAEYSEVLLPDETNDLWFALAMSQWECKELHPHIFATVKSIIESDSDVTRWKELGATDSEAKKRRKVLDAFLAKLQSERATAKKRKKKVIREPIFARGDCLTFQLSNGNFGGAVVLEAERDTEHGLNLVALTRINQAPKPTIKDFAKAEVLVKNWGNWEDYAAVCWIYNYRAKEVTSLFEVVGSLEIVGEFLSQTEKYKYGFTSGWKSALIDCANAQFESERGRARSQEKLFISKFVRPAFWKLWR